MTQTTWRRTMAALAALLILFGLAAFALGMSYGLEADGASTVVLAPGSGQPRPAEIA